MKISQLESRDIDGLKMMQPETWSDIRLYFYFYCRSGHCDPIKITENGEIVAVGTSIRHTDSAWLAHIIVHPDHRSKGLGNLLASSLIDRLDRSVISTIYLDATDMGYPVYKKLGFEVETVYIHLDGKLTDQYLLDPSCVIPFDEKYREEILALDRSISQEDRSWLLAEHLNFAILYVVSGKLQGAYFPTLLDSFIIASNNVAGTELMKIRMRTKDKARFPAGNQAATDFLTGNGYTEAGTSRRMLLGKKRDWNPEGIFGRISGGLG